MVGHCCSVRGPPGSCIDTEISMRTGVYIVKLISLNGRQLQVSQELERDLATAVEKALSGSR